VVCVECLPADKPWDVVSVTRRSSGVAPRACVRVYARVLVPPNMYMHTYIHIPFLYYTQEISKATVVCYLLQAEGVFLRAFDDRSHLFGQRCVLSGAVISTTGHYGRLHQSGIMSRP